MLYNVSTMVNLWGASRDTHAEGMDASRPADNCWFVNLLRCHILTSSGV